MPITQIPKKLKIKQLRDLFVEYNRALQEMIPYGENLAALVLHDFCEDVKEEDLSLVANGRGPTVPRQLYLRIIVAMNALTADERLVVQNEFIHRAKRDWWVGSFSRSQFYRKRDKAIDTIYSILF